MKTRFASRPRARAAVCNTRDARRGDGLERRHEFGRITILELPPSHRLARCHQAAETLIGLRHVGHEHEFVSRVEPYDGPYRPARGKEGSEPAVCEDALDEVLAQPRIVEPPFFLNRQQGKA